MINENEIQKIIQLLESRESVNRALGAKLLESQEAFESILQWMSNEARSGFYPNHSPAYILHHFTGQFTRENQKRILTEVDQQLSNKKLLQQFSDFSEYLSVGIFKRKVFNILADVTSMRRWLPFAQLGTIKEEDYLNTIRLLTLIQANQLMIFFKTTNPISVVQKIISELVYLNTLVDDVYELKRAYRNIVKRGIVANVSPTSLTYLDIVRRSRSPVQFLFSPQGDEEQIEYVMKVAVELKKNVSSK